MADAEKELVQVAAVCCAIIENLDRGKADFDGLIPNTMGRPALQGEAVLFAVGQERRRQDAKWGPQHHTPGEWLMILAEEIGEMADAIDLQLPPAGDGMRFTAEEDEEMYALYLTRQGLIELGRGARAWLRSHQWPDAHHLAISQEEI